VDGALDADHPEALIYEFNGVAPVAGPGRCHPEAA